METNITLKIKKRESSLFSFFFFFIFYKTRIWERKGEVLFWWLIHQWNSCFLHCHETSLAPFFLGKGFIWLSYVGTNAFTVQQIAFHVDAPHLSFSSLARFEHILTKLETLFNTCKKNYKTSAWYISNL